MLPSYCATPPPSAVAQWQARASIVRRSVIESNRHRYASATDLDTGNAMTPRQLVEDAIRRLTDGTLTFTLAEDAYTIAARFMLDGRTYVQAWSKAHLVDDCHAADAGLRQLLAQPNHAQR